MNNNVQVLQRMKEDILLRGLSKNTLESYTKSARVFLEYCNSPVEKLDENNIRNFLWHLIKWNRQSQRRPKREPPLFRTGTTRVVPVLRIATLFGYHSVSQWYT